MLVVRNVRIHASYHTYRYMFAGGYVEADWYATNESVHEKSFPGEGTDRSDGNDAPQGIEAHLLEFAAS